MSDEQSLQMLRSMVPQMNPTAQQRIQQLLSDGTPPAQIVNMIRQSHAARAQQQMPSMQPPVQAQQPYPSATPFNGPMVDAQSAPNSHNIDADTAAKQMAALNAASQRRNVGGPQPSQPPFAPGGPGIRPGMQSGPSQHQTPQTATPRNSSRPQFLNLLHMVHMNIGQPVPPALTAIPNPAYDHTGKYKALEIPAEGYVRLAGRPIDLLDLFTLVANGAGGYLKATSSNVWPAVATRLQLPESYLPPNHPNPAPINVIALLQQYYQVLLFPVEQHIQQQKERNSTHTRQPSAPGVMPIQSLPGVPGGPPGSIPLGPIGSRPTGPIDAPLDPAALVVGQKRKVTSGTDSPGKRTRQRLEDEPVNTEPVLSTAVMPTEAAGKILPPEGLPSDETQRRYKIEYVPVYRPLDSYGGRRLDEIEAQLQKVKERRVIKNPDELGTIDIDGLSMSLRSGLGTEISYAITTLTFLSYMPIKGKAGLILSQCEDLLDVLVDLLEDEMFGEEEEDEVEVIDVPPAPRKIWSRKGLLDAINYRLPFAPSAAGVDSGRRETSETPARTALAIVNLLRNFSLIEENHSFMSKTPRLLDVLARTSEIIVGEDGTYRPSSQMLTLPDLVVIHHDTLAIVSNLGPTIRLSKQQRRTTRRLYALILASIVDPSDAVPPSKTPGFPLSHVDTANDAFSRVAQPDGNRAVLIRLLPHSELVAHFGALVTMLPITDGDFSATLASREVLEQWQGALERLSMCMYNIIFMAPPALKRTLRQTPGLGPLVIRMVRYYLDGVRTSDGAQFAPKAFDKNPHAILGRRALEGLAMLDRGEDSFNPVSSAPVAFAPPPPPLQKTEEEKQKEVVTEAKKEGDGLGMLATRAEEVFHTLLIREGMDDLVFAELESLIRVNV